MGRVLLGGIVGGILMMAWGYLSHSVLFLVEKKVQELPREDAVVSAVRENVAGAGIYRYPYFDFEKAGDPTAQKVFDEKHKKGPAFWLVRAPDGLPAMDTMQLVWELASNIAAALIAAMVVAGMGTSRPAPTKVVFVTLLGVFAWLSQDASYWIWHHYPTDYELATLVDATAGWFIAGIGIAAMVRAKAPAR